MSFYTELLFNEVELADGCLHAFRQAALAALGDPDCSWSLLLKYLTVECSDYRTIDLQLSKKMKGELTNLHGTPPFPFSKLGKPTSGDKDNEDDGDRLRYTLQWYPHDGYAEEWPDVADFAEWLARFCASGQLFEFTIEDGGDLWGWEFDNGKIRDLELKPKGRWRKPA